MGSIPRLFNTGKSGIMSSRAQLSTTGHNIANVNTDGYSRQRVEQETATTVQGTGGQTFGTGTRITDVDRIHDDFLEMKIYDQAKNVGFSEEQGILMGEAVSIFNEANTEGLNKIMARFFNAWRELANDPQDDAKRTVLRASAEEVTKDFHRVNRQLKDVIQNADAKVSNYVAETNKLIKHIGELNHGIRQMEIKGGKAADLLDQRDVALKELSKLIDIKVGENEKGQFIVNVKGIGAMVVGTQTLEFETATTPADEEGKPEGSLDVLIKGAPRPPITHELKGGKLGGILDVRDRVVADALRKLDDLAYKLTSEVNVVHRQGVGRDGKTGRGFFIDQLSIDRASEKITLTDDILKSNEAVSASLAPDSPSDNRVALAIATLQDKPVFGNGTVDFDAFYDGIVTDIAVKANKNELDLEHQKAILKQLETHKDSISGVSLDEEAANLVQFQHTYNANAQVLKVADELLMEILNLRR